MCQRESVRCSRFAIASLKVPKPARDDCAPKVTCYNFHNLSPGKEPAVQEKKTVTVKERLVQLIEEMTVAEQAAVLEVVRVMIANRSQKHSISELKGLGKEIWDGIDAQEYIDELRGPKCS